MTYEREEKDTTEQIFLKGKEKGVLTYEELKSLLPAQGHFETNTDELVEGLDHLGARVNEGDTGATGQSASGGEVEEVQEEAEAPSTEFDNLIWTYFKSMGQKNL